MVSHYATYGDFLDIQSINNSNSISALFKPGCQANLGANEK